MITQPLSRIQLEELRHLAEATALLAGHQLKTNQADWGKIEIAQDRDVKVKADKLAEAIILTQLKAATDFPILTEETGWHGEPQAQHVWIVDPLDGSFNYHQGIPFCGVAIALTIAGEPILGVIYDFNHEELFSGVVGTGAWLNEQPISVSQTDQLSQAVLNTGFPARLNIATAGAVVMQRGAAYRKVRMLGSAALALAYVAAGRADVYHEQGTLFWDVAAGCALVKAAGGAYQLQGEVFTHPLSVVAHNGKLNPPISE